MFCTGLVLLNALSTVCFWTYIASIDGACTWLVHTRKHDSGRHVPYRNIVVQLQAFPLHGPQLHQILQAY